MKPPHAVLRGGALVWAAGAIAGLRDNGNGAVGAYTRLDTRVGRRSGENLELSIVAQNLLLPRHTEFLDAYEVRRTLVERSILAKMSWPD